MRIHRRITIALLLLLAPEAARPTALASGSQPVAADPTLARPAFRAFRYDEDWSAFADPSLHTRPLDELKYIRLADDPDVSLSLGGESRTRYEYFKNPGFGLRGLSRDDYVLQRLLLHADLRIGSHLRIFTQPVSAWQFGPESPRSPIQDDRLDLQQAFVDLVLGDPKGDSLTLRAGRMEMSYGSSRLVSSREPANVRLNFDGVRGTLRVAGATIDAFLTRPVEQELGVFNDGQNDSQTFWGLYSTVPINGRRLNIDVYYFGLERENARFDSGVASDRRHSVGGRLWGLIDGLDYDVEGVFQFGEFGEDDIVAWTLASNVGYTWENAAWKPRVGLKANVASGDTDPSDSTQGTFFAMFPRQGYFSEINLLAPSNFFDLHPSLQVRPREDLSMTLSWDPYWKFSEDDAIYSPRGVAIPANRSAGRYVGSTLNGQLDWTISPQASFTAFVAYFFAGEAVTSAGGEDASYFGSWITFKF